MSYCEIAWGLLAFASEGVPGLPAYLILAMLRKASVSCPGGEFSAPGEPHVVPGAPGCPGPLGLGFAEAKLIVPNATNPAINMNKTIFINSPPFVSLRLKASLKSL